MKFDDLRFHPQVVVNRFIPTIPTKHWGNVYAGGAPWHFSDTPERMFEPPYPGDHQEDFKLREFHMNLSKTCIPIRATYH